VMVDMSHANSEKKHKNQLSVCADVCEQLEAAEKRLFGVMIESNLCEGNQAIGDGTGLTYGQSITDACLGWEDSTRCLAMLAKAANKRSSQG